MIKKKSSNPLINPTRGELRIENGELIMENVEIYDIMGRSVGAKSVRPNDDTTIIDVSHLAPGVYFLRMGDRTAKFVKQ